MDFYIIFKVDFDFWAASGAKATCIWRINICINKLCMHDILQRHLGKLHLYPTENRSGTKVIVVR